MIKKFTYVCISNVQRFMSVSFIFALIFTLIVVVLDFILVPNPSMSGMIKAWYGGVWGNKFLPLVIAKEIAKKTSE